MRKGHQQSKPPPGTAKEGPHWGVPPPHLLPLRLPALLLSAHHLQVLQAPLVLLALKLPLLPLSALLLWTEGGGADG